MSYVCAMIFDFNSRKIAFKMEKIEMRNEFERKKNNPFHSILLSNSLGDEGSTIGNLLKYFSPPNFPREKKCCIEETYQAFFSSQ
jgi:hypothetical protein